MVDYLRFAKACKDAKEAMTTKPQSTTETLEPCPLSHYVNAGLRAHKTGLDQRIVCLDCGLTLRAPDWIKVYERWQSRPAKNRHYFCSCGAALTAEEYITHFLELGHDRGDPAFTASAAPVVDNEDRTRCASCKHEFCKVCYDISECCECGTQIPPRTVAERLAQHKHIEIVEGVLGGVTPLVDRRRISVHHILSYLYNGEDIDYIAENYQLSPEAIKDAIAFAQEVYDDAVDSALRTPAAATAAPQLHWPFAAKHQNCAECDKEYELPPAAALVEQQTFKNTKEAMLYAQRNNIPAAVPVDQYYCPEHKYNPPPNSGLAFCPQCEIAALDRSKLARAAAEEIREWIGISGLVDGKGIDELAAIIERNCGNNQ